MPSSSAAPWATTSTPVEFAVERGIPYAIDFMNPVPDADLHSVGQANFDWMVKEVADLAIARAKSAPQAQELRGRAFMGLGSCRREGGKEEAGSEEEGGGEGEMMHHNYRFCSTVELRVRWDTLPFHGNFGACAKP